MLSNAQWYVTQFDVTNMNELTKPQLNLALEQTEKTIVTGQVLTAIGALSTIIGGVIYTQGLNDIVESDINDINKGVNKATAGALVLTGGCAALGIGIPVWIVGGNRKNTINIHLAKFQDTSCIPSIGFKLTF